MEQAPGNSPTVVNVMRPLSDAAGWMKLIGTLGIIYGVLMALSIVGIVIAWLPIWMGVLLRKAAVEAQAAHRSGDEAAAVAATSSLRTIFKVQGIMILVGLAVWAAMVLVLIIMLVAAGVSQS